MGLFTVLHRHITVLVKKGLYFRIDITPPPSRCSQSTMVWCTAENGQKEHREYAENVFWKQAPEIWRRVC